MSRDQRPGKVEMIDDAAMQLAENPVAGAAAQGAKDGAGTADGAAESSPKKGILLGTALFLLACIAGAAAISMLPVFGA